jgi:hypothetical protein
VLHALLLFAIELVLKIDILFIHTAGCTSCKFESLRSPAPADADAPPVRLAGGLWLVLVCSERKVLLAH